MDAAVRDAVRERASHRCEYCRLAQHQAPVARFHIEHIVARQHGGGDNPRNLALACPRCNRSKGPNLRSIDPSTNEVVPLFNPRTQSWHDHFALRGVHIIGLTATGRATVQLLKMNADERIEIRSRLLERGDLTV
jgi:hypothetical protein